MINTSGKYGGGGGGGGCARCQAASGVGAPDSERGEGLAAEAAGEGRPGAGLGRRRARDPLEVRADFPPLLTSLALSRGRAESLGAAIALCRGWELVWWTQLKNCREGTSSSLEFLIFVRGKKGKGGKEEI